MAIYRKQGRYGSALEYHKRAVKNVKVLFGERHLVVQAALIREASILRYRGELGDLDQIRETLEAAVKKYEEVLGPYHPVTLASMKTLASTYSEGPLYRLVEARRLL